LEVIRLNFLKAIAFLGLMVLVGCATQAAPGHASISFAGVKVFDEGLLQFDATVIGSEPVRLRVVSGPYVSTSREVELEPGKLVGVRGYVPASGMVVFELLGRSGVRDSVSVTP
jgi:hypothetical protein